MRVSTILKGSLERLPYSQHRQQLWAPRLLHQTDRNLRYTGTTDRVGASSGVSVTSEGTMSSLELVQQLHGTKTKLVLFLTGGGSQVLFHYPDLESVSNTMPVTSQRSTTGTSDGQEICHRPSDRSALYVGHQRHAESSRSIRNCPGGTGALRHRSNTGATGPEGCLVLQPRDCSSTRQTCV